MLEASWTEKIQVRRVHTRKFKGDLAAVSLQPCEAGGIGGIALYDVTNPRHPRELAVFENGVSGVHELWMQVRGKRVYVYQATIFEEIFQFFDGLEPGNPDFRVIDVSDPRSPEQVGQWGAWEELDIVPTAANGSFPFNFVHSMIGNEDGDRVYLSYWDIGTVILDMSDPTDPEFIGRTSFGPNQEGNAHSSWLADRERILIENQEDSDPTFTPGIEDGFGYTRIFDISKESRPRLLTEFRMPSQPAPPGPGDFTVARPEGARRHAVHVALRRGRRGARHRAPVAAAPDRAVRAAAGRRPVRVLVRRRARAARVGRLGREGPRARVGHQQRPLDLQDERSLTSTARSRSLQATRAWSPASRSQVTCSSALLGRS